MQTQGNLMHFMHRCQVHPASTASSVCFETQQVILCDSTPLFAGSAWEQHFVRQVIELHDKYMLYVGGCFANSSLFHKALKEAFEFFCNKNVAGSSTAELMANFCDNLLRKVCNAAASCYSSHAPASAQLTALLMLLL